MSTLSSSVKRLGPKLLVLELLGNAALLIAAALWLEIPDSHTWELVLSLLIGAVLLAGILGLHSCILRMLRAAQDSCALWLSATLLAAWIILFHVPTMLAHRWSPATSQRASYWNSQLSPHMRTVFSYERLVHWQLAAFDFFIWFLVPALLLPFVLETVARGLGGSAWRNALRTLMLWKYWATCIVTGLLFHFAIFPLVDWQPAHTVRGEIVSVVLRLGIVYVAGILLLTLTFAITAWLLAQCDVARDAASQPPNHNPKPALLDE